MLVGVGLMINAALALQFSDQIEGVLGMTPTEQDKRYIQETMPRVTTVDRAPKEPPP